MSICHHDLIRPGIARPADRSIHILRHQSTETCIREQLDRALKPRRLTLRLYPSSYPSSTVGGWLAQGGVGFGCYEFGPFIQNVVSARVVLPNGDVKTFSGDDLVMIGDAEGTTGIISEVTLQVMKREALGLTAIACPDAHMLSAVFQDFIARNLPIWSLVFINPRMAEMKNRAPVRMHLGHPAEHKVELPAAYIAVLAYRASDRDRIVPVLPDILRGRRGEILSQEIADHEWENRFKLMIVKRLGPSLVPLDLVLDRRAAPAHQGRRRTGSARRDPPASRA